MGKNGSEWIASYRARTDIGRMCVKRLSSVRLRTQQHRFTSSSFSVSFRNTALKLLYWESGKARYPISSTPYTPAPLLPRSHRIGEGDMEYNFICPFYLLQVWVNGACIGGEWACVCACMCMGVCVCVFDLCVPMCACQMLLLLYFLFFRYARRIQVEDWATFGFSFKDASKRLVLKGP